MVSEREMELALPLVPDFELTAADAAMELARELGMSEEEVDEIAHALIEACINVREHSCCEDGRIYLRFNGSSTATDVRLDIWITDHGKGFNPDEVRARRAKLPAGPRKRGWGLQIMEAHMDEIEILSGSDGTTVHMVKTSTEAGR